MGPWVSQGREGLPLRGVRLLERDGAAVVHVGAAWLRVNPEAQSPKDD